MFRGIKLFWGFMFRGIQLFWGFMFTGISAEAEASQDTRRGFQVLGGPGARGGNDPTSRSPPINDHSPKQLLGWSTSKPAKPHMQA